MMRDDVLQVFAWTTCAGLTPAVVAVLKDSPDVIIPVAVQGQTMRWVSRNKDTKEVTEVSVENFQDRLDQHPFVWCFFLNVLPSKKTIKKIMPSISDSDVQIILGYVLHSADSKTATTIVRNFSQYVSSFDQDLAVPCILWNKPEALYIVLSKVVNIDIGECRYSGFNLKSIAEFLCHAQCVRVLEAFKECTDTTNKGTLDDPISRFLENVHQQTYNSGARKASPYTCLVFIYMLYLYSYECESICPLFSKISGNNFGVNQQDDDVFRLGAHHENMSV